MIAKVGSNCWQRPQATRAAVLIDAAAYFEALADALERAERSVFVVGWDIDGRLQLRREQPPGTLFGDEGGQPLRDGLNQLVARRPQLRIYLLSWDYALVYALERQWLPLISLGWRTDRRICFELDDHHPPGGAHHQKLVVIDDRLAFCGGIDLTRYRWDTSAHLPDDERRKTTDDVSFGAFHDLQVAVEGPAASCLGQLARQRWHQATGRAVAATDGGRAAQGRDDGPSPWPADLVADFEDLPVALARTAASPNGTEIREVEQLYLDAIESARETIYIENQYLSARSIGDALARRLSAADGPEVVIVGPRQASGWLESRTMDVLRARIVRQLREADTYGRLRLYYPGRRDGPPTYVHAKTMIVDDQAFRVGSANLSNRSMGLDTELDLLIEAGGAADRARTIRAVRARLLAEHLGLASADDFERELAQHRRLNACLDALVGGQRTLIPLQTEVPQWLDRTVPDPAPFDPPAPLQPGQLFGQLVPDELADEAQHPVLRRVVPVAATAAVIALVWALAPVDAAPLQRVLSAADALDRSGWQGAAAATAALALAAMLAVPLNLLILASAMIFGPLGGLLSLGGSLLSAALSFFLGKQLPRRSVRWLGGKRLNRIGHGLARGGVRGVAAVRLLPVASFALVNLVAGASRLRPIEFLAGTAVGLLPGLLVLTLFGWQLESTLQDPSALHLAGTAALLGLMIGALLLLQRFAPGGSRRPGH